MSVTVDTSQLDDLLREHFSEVVDDAVEAMLLDIEEHAPRDTGEMVNTMTITEVDTSRSIGRDIRAPAEYASYQEEGTGIYIGEDRIRPIPPNKALHFHWKKLGIEVFFASVAGTPTTHWFSEPLSRWREFLEQAIG